MTKNGDNSEVRKVFIITVERLASCAPSLHTGVQDSSASVTRRLGPKSVPGYHKNDEIGSYGPMTFENVTYYSNYRYVKWTKVFRFYSSCETLTISLVV